MKLTNLPPHVAEQIANGAKDIHTALRAGGHEGLRRQAARLRALSTRSLTMNTIPNNGGIYAIKDIVADALVGILQIFRHDAAAVRFFGDVASDPQSMINKHVEDYELWQLGIITLDNKIEPEDACVITGRTWAAAQQQAPHIDANTFGAKH